MHKTTFLFALFDASIFNCPVLDEVALHRRNTYIDKSDPPNPSNSPINILQILQVHCCTSWLFIEDENLFYNFFYYYSV